MGSQFHYTMDMGGVAAILKSAPVKAELDSLAESKAQEANRRMHSSMPNTRGHDGYKAGKAKPLTFTAVSSVYTGSRAAMKDQERHQTLNAINH
ncbi:MAG: hypothetical protein HFJ65_03400 [Eggerthellaceae bacterium]|nr:hypothetical protein [Eggerthellaceae bacterium]